MSSSRATNRLVGFVVGLLLLTGCASTGTAADRGSRVGEPRPSPTASTPATPRGARTTGARASVAGAPAAPAVPQYRATLPPPVKERPRPARFRAGSIDVDLPVISTGVADDGRMQLPETNREVAWYSFGSRPGDPAGTTVMAAHVDTRAEGLGPFARLRTLNRGDTIDVVDADGKTHSYTVTAVEDVKKSVISLDQLFRVDGDPELKVLTCGGPYRRSTGYRDNIVVTALPR